MTQPFAFTAPTDAIDWSRPGALPDHRVALDVLGVRALALDFRTLVASLQPRVADWYLGLGTDGEAVLDAYIHRVQIATRFASTHVQRGGHHPGLRLGRSMGPRSAGLDPTSDRSLVESLLAAGIATGLHFHPECRPPVAAPLPFATVTEPTTHPLVRGDGAPWRFRMRLGEAASIYADERRHLAAALMGPRAARRYLALDPVHDIADRAEAWLMRVAACQELADELAHEQRVLVATDLPPYKGKRKPPRRSYSEILDPDTDASLLETLGFTGAVIICVNPERPESVDLYGPREAL